MLLIKNATILDGLGNRLENKMIKIVDGKIVEIADQMDENHSSDVIDAVGKIITPGLIDVHTHLGVDEMDKGEEGQDLNEVTSAVTPEVRALDGINPADTGFEDARKAGVTTVQVMPGSSNVIGGEMSVLKTAGHIVDQMIIRESSGMKAALGENPKMSHGGDAGRAPVTRMGVIAQLRESFMKAKKYEEQDKSYANFDLGMENLLKVLRKEMPLRVHAHRADDIVSALRIQREFDIDLSIEHCTEGHKIADFIAEHDVFISIGPTMSPRSKIELAEKTWATVKAIADVNLPYTLTTDHSVIGIEHLITTMILAHKNGLSETEALQAITINAAKHLGVEDRVGSIEVGKDADLAIWDGDIFDLRSEVIQTIIDGKIVYEKMNNKINI